MGLYISFGSSLKEFITLGKHKCFSLKQPLAIGIHPQKAVDYVE